MLQSSTLNRRDFILPDWEGNGKNREILGKGNVDGDLDLPSGSR
jgi:hypothetical protein